MVGDHSVPSAHRYSRYRHGKREDRGADGTECDPYRQLLLSRATLITLIAGVCAAAQMSTARSANEDALLELWTQHLASPDDHAGVVKSCTLYSRQPRRPSYSCRSRIRVMAWVSGRPHAEGVKLIEPDLVAPPGPVTDGARLVALGWMTRMDREKVAAALQLYIGRRSPYRKRSSKSTRTRKFPRTRVRR